MKSACLGETTGQSRCRGCTGRAPGQASTASFATELCELVDNADERLSGVDLNGAGSTQQWLDLGQVPQDQRPLLWRLAIAIRTPIGRRSGPRARRSRPRCLTTPSSLAHRYRSRESRACPARPARSIYRFPTCRSQELAARSEANDRPANHLPPPFLLSRSSGCRTDDAGPVGGFPLWSRELPKQDSSPHHSAGDIGEVRLAPRQTAEI